MDFMRDIEIPVRVFTKRNTFILWGNKNKIQRGGTLVKHAVKINDVEVGKDDYKMELKKDGTISVILSYPVEPLSKPWTITVFGKSIKLKKAKPSTVKICAVISYKFNNESKNVIIQQRGRQHDKRNSVQQLPKRNGEFKVFGGNQHNPGTE